jgi:hypothetical protein
VNSGFTKLAVETVTEPQSVIGWLQSLQLSREVLWCAMGLIIVLNALLFGLTNIIAPPVQSLPAVFTSPLLFATLTGTGFVLTVYAVFYIGRGFGGGGSFEIVLVSLVWLQGLRLLVQVALSLIMVISPTFSALLAFAGSLLGCWILINFINLFHGFNSMFTALIVMVVVGLAVVLGLVGLLSVLGPDILGLSSYV